MREMRIRLLFPFVFTIDENNTRRQSIIDTIGEGARSSVLESDFASLIEDSASKERNKQVTERGRHAKADSFASRVVVEASKGSVDLVWRQV
ncbi:hypothetical protein H9L39_19309 [Fusarium oxysporum f. sp. albedinis]|nr:hypothetical protein H9L39_19309 [Fusarium oxysporum f. sp. albedinis]